MAVALRILSEEAELRVQIGSQVTVHDDVGEDTFTIVAEGADAAIGRISADTPMARALIGHQEGDRVVVRAPGGRMHVTILAIS